MKFINRKDGVGFLIQSGQVQMFACCDCGLVHNIVFVSEDGKPIGVAAQRNRKATAKRRET